MVGGWNLRHAVATQRNALHATHDTVFVSELRRSSWGWLVVYPLFFLGPVHQRVWSKWEKTKTNWLVVSTHLINISQNGSFPQVRVNIKNVWNHHLECPAKSQRSRFLLLGNPPVPFVQVVTHTHEQATYLYKAPWEIHRSKTTEGPWYLEIRFTTKRWSERIIYQKTLLTNTLLIREGWWKVMIFLVDQFMLDAPNMVL